MAIDQSALDIALYTALTGGTALTALLAGTASVYYGLAPRGSAFDYVIFNQQAGGIIQTAAECETEDPAYLVKGISSTSIAAAVSIANEIHNIMASDLNVSGYTNLWQERAERVKYTEVADDGQLFYHAGYVYQFRLEEA